MLKHKILFIIIGIIFTVSAAYITVLMVDNSKVEEVSPEEDKLIINGEEITFKYYRVDQLFFLSVPQSFKIWDEVTLLGTYPNNDRPELVFESQDGTTQIQITTTEQDMTDDLLTTFVETTRESLQSLVETVETDFYTKYDKNFGQIKYTEINDSGNYHDIRYFTLNNKLVKVEFITIKQEQVDWEEASNIILESICFDSQYLEN